MKLFDMGKTLFRHAGTLLVVMAISVLLYSCGSSSSSDGGTESIPLSSPKNFVITPKSASLDIAWTKLASVLDVDATYEVYIGTTADNTQKLDLTPTIAGNLVSCTVSALADGTALVNGQTYYVRLRAIYDGVGSADLSDAMEGMPVPPPATPVISSQLGYEEMLEVVWSDVQYAVNYKVYWKAGSTETTPDDDAEVEIVTNPRALIKDVTNGSAYRVWIQAMNNAGESGYDFEDITPAAATVVPDTPTSTGFTAVSSSQTVTVSWAAVANARSYVLKYSTVSGNSKAAGYTEVAVDAESGTVTQMVTGLTNGTTYYFSVKAVNSIGETAYTSLGSAVPASKAATTPIDFSDIDFELGTANSEYIFAEDVPASAFFPTGRSSDRLTRFKEAAIGNLFCDGTAWYVADKYEDVDFVFLNGGYIEGAIAQGTVTVGSIMRIIPSDSLEDTLTVISLTGEQVIDLFRRAAAVVHTGRGSKNTGSFAMVSSPVNYTIQYKTWDDTTWDGTTALTSTESSEYQYGWIKEDTLKINGVAIDPTATYRVATTSYLADGNEGYITFLSGTDRVDHTEYLWEAVSNYIYEMGSITPYLDGRMSLIGGVPLQAPGWKKGALDWVAPYDQTTYMQ
ncbi:MAG: 5'-nucleotidase C-terminal domain-containing protein [Deferribacterales bacterium]